MTTEVFAFPASFAQRRLWFLEQLEPGSASYNLPFAVRLNGQLDVTVLEQSFQEIIRRHEALRTSLIAVNGQPVQAIAPSVSFSLPVINLQNLPEDQRETQAQKLATEEAQRPFILSESPLMRVKLLQLGLQEHILLLTMHHTITDGWSVGVLLQELATLYKAFLIGKPSPLADLQLQYADFSVWQQEWLQGEVLENQLAYWKQQLEQLTTLQLPTDRPRTALQTFRGATQTWKIPQDLAKALTAFSQQAGVTLFMTLLAGFNTLLYRYTGQDDIVVGSAIANRTWAESEDIIGIFVNTLVLRTQMNDNPSFQELVNRVREMTLAAYAHQDLPFEKLVDELQPERDLSRNPLFQVWFALHNQPMPTLQLGDLTLKPISVESGTAQFDLSLDVYLGEQELTGTIEYSTELFDPSTIARMIEHFENLLYAIVANPQTRLSELTFLSATERHQLLVEWSGTQTSCEETLDTERNLCIHQLFADQAERTPDAVAIVFEDKQLTYGELNQRANQVANYLQFLGIPPEALIGICMECCLEMIVGILGILKAGGAYVPLDPAYPQERLAFMLADAQVSILLTQQQLVQNLPAHSAKVICLDSDWQIIQQHSQTNPQPNPAALAYIIYTSGTTSQPKGVMVAHSSLVNAYFAWEEAYELRSLATAHLQMASFSFDVFAGNLVRALCSGAKLVLCPRDLLLAPAELYQLMRQQKIDCADFVPAVLRNLCKYLQQTGQSLDFMQLLIVGSDTWYVQEHQAIQSLCGVNTRLIHCYGVTEATIDTTYFQNTIADLSGNRLVPIGRPFARQQVYILDSYLQPVPIGVPGELHIGGAGLANGYYQRPDLTAQKFIPHPFAETSQRLYKTGDIARYLPNGDIEYLGRIDHQVKIRGFRVELAEVESILSRHPEIEAALAVVREDQPGDKRLVAYVVPADKSNLSISSLRQFLKEKLPNYMVPSAFVMLDCLPVSANGKIDRRALPIPDSIRPELEATFVAAQNAVEAALAQIWSEVLGVKQVGIYDNFFELGGDSILSIQVVGKANQQGLQVTPKQLFQSQTIAELATVVGTTQAVQAEQGLVTGALPLTPIQHWFFAENFAQPYHYNQANLLVLHQTIKPELLQQVVQQLLVHHDALRLRFTQTDAGWQQVNATCNAEVPFLQVDLSALSITEQQSQITAIATQLQASLNLSTGALVKVALFDLGRNQPSRLLFIIHHLAVDGVSWRILLEDFQTAYTQLSRGQTIQLPAKSTSFQHWAKRLLKYGHSATLQQELDYWLAQGEKSVSPLPLDFPAGVNTVESAGIVSVALNVAETQALLQEVPTAYRTQINEVLLTALGQAFANWTGETSLLVDLEGHGREELFADVDLSRTVGWFTSVFPVSLDLGEIDDVVEVLKTVKEQLRCIPNQGIGYGLLRYLSPEEIAQRLQPEVSFNYLGQFDIGMAQSELLAIAPESIGSVQSPLAIRSYLIEIDCLITNNQLQMDWTYSKAIHRQSTVENLAQGFVEVLRSLIASCKSADSGSYTPSDFSAAKIGQKDFDKLLAKLNQVGRRSAL